VAERAGDYSACGGDFYARGHIRAIAKAAGAAPEPLIREFDVTRQIPQALTLAGIFHDTPATPIMAGTVATLKPDGRGRRQPLRRALCSQTPAQVSYPSDCRLFALTPTCPFADPAAQNRRPGLGGWKPLGMNSSPTERVRGRITDHE
jgi:hypothetical protein